MAKRWVLSAVGICLLIGIGLVLPGPPADAATPRSARFGHVAGNATPPLPRTDHAALVAPLTLANASYTDASTVVPLSDSTAVTGTLTASTKLKVNFGTDGSILFDPDPASPTGGVTYTTPTAVIVVSFAGHTCGTGSNMGKDTAALAVDQYTPPSSGSTPRGFALSFSCNDPGFTISGTVAYNVLPTTPGQGNYLYGAAGELAGFGNDNYLSYLGDLTQTALNSPIASMAITPDGAGYWMTGGDGGVFAYGDAGFYGSTGNIHLNQPVVGMAATPSGKGYWFVAADGGIFAYGDAGFFGSTGNIHLNKPVVGMAATPSGKGYWLVASDGGIFAYGDAGFHGSTGNIALNKPVVGMTPTHTGQGYWFVASDGGIFAYGDAGFHGSTGNMVLNQPVVGMAATADDQGYWFVASDGGVFSFGDAPFHGGLGGSGVTDVVGMATSPLLS